MRGVLVMAALVPALLGCEWGAAAPKEALSGYLLAVLQERHEDAYRYISNRDQKLISLFTFHFEAHEICDTTRRVMLEHASYKIKKVNLRNGKEGAVAQVVVTLPKREVVQKALAEGREEAEREARLKLAGFSPAERSRSLQEETRKALQRRLNDLHYRRMLDTESYRTTFDLVREPEGWKVFLGWDGKEPLTMGLLLGRVELGF